MANPLATSRYTLCSTYIGQILTRTSVTTEAVNRYPVFIGKGSRYAVIRDQEVLRSYREGVVLSFPDTGTLQVSIATYPSDGLKTNATMYTSDGSEVNKRYWDFAQSVSGGDWDLVQLNAAAYSKNKTYYLDYQSTSRDLKDDFPVADLRQIISVGRSAGEDFFLEDTHFKINTTLTDPEVASASNPHAYPTATEGNIDQSLLASSPISFDATSAFAGSYSRLFTFTINTDTHTISWTGISAGADSTTDPATSGSFTYEPGSATNLATIENGLVLNVDGPSVAMADNGKTFLATAWGPAKLELTSGAEYEAYDDREYNIEITAVTFDGTDNIVSFTWSTDTPEGSWGTATANDYEAVTLPDGISLRFFNLGRTLNPSSTIGTGCQRHFATSGPSDPVKTANDIWKLTATNDETIDWSLTESLSETFMTSNLILDKMGVITGTRLSYYLILRETPYSITSVTDPATGSSLSYTHITGTPYIWFPSGAPTTSVQVSYTSRGNEPLPGETYYISCMTLRPSTYFDKGIFLQTQDQAKAVLAPNMVDENENYNELYMMSGEIAFSQSTDLQGCYVIQVSDYDQDGIYQETDYDRAIEASEKKQAYTDVVLLNRYSKLDEIKTSVEKMNSPFEAKERLAWFGLPNGTAVGDADTEDTIVYLAKKSFQFYGESVGHGSIIMIANNWADHSTLYYDGSTATVRLDGSYIAGALASLNAGFADPGLAILKTTVGGFDDMHDFEEDEQLLVGAAGCVFIVKESPVFRVMESTTLDRLSADTTEISAMCQKQYVTRVIRDECNSSLIGVTPPSASAGVKDITNVIGRKLRSLVNDGKIAKYTDDSGNERAFNASEDIEVYRDSSDPTKYWFKYWYVLRYPIKRLFGLFSVDSKSNWSAYSEAA